MAQGDPGEQDDLDTASVTVTATPSNGITSLLGDGTFAYTPNPEFTGVDAFEYEVCDAGSSCDTATVTVGVLEEPQPVLDFTSVTVGDDFVTASLKHVYVSPVVVCSARYANNAIPVVVRVDNVASDHFDIWLQNSSDPSVAKEVVGCLVVEESISSLSPSNIISKSVV